MSKMPAKKKSCFQITSVTTAQAASSITEDTESLDDPDESRTEDVSSEIFDVSRATDFGPEEAAERSSSEETLNNVGETPGTMSPNVQEAPLPRGSTACSSRFRVIKLDHGSGEPYRRGRWTCTEYYDRDSADSTVLSRTAADTQRDSGLGATGPDSMADSAVSQPPAGGAVYSGQAAGQSYSHNGKAPQTSSQQFTYSQAQMASGPMLGGQADYHLSALQGPGHAAAGSGAPPSLPGQPPPPMGLHSTKPGDSVSPGSGLTAPSHPGHGQPVTASSQLSNIPGGHHAMTPGLHNVPTSGITSSVPSVSATPVTMPIAPSPTFVQSPLSSHTSVSRSNSLIPTVGLGTSNVHGSLPQAATGPFQSQPSAGQMDDRRKSEPLPQPPIALISEKAFVKVPITDPLTNPLHLPVFGLPIPVDGEDDSSSSANVVAIDNKIEQAMDLVKSHLMYAVREEVEVLKEQIKELIEKNSTLERENALLKSLSNSDQLSQLSTQVVVGTCQQPPPVTTASHPAPQTAPPPQQPNVSSA